MAEFAGVMRNWARMCESKCWCGDCPIKNKIEVCPVKLGVKTDLAGVEKAVEAWAAEHPEQPVYPTWIEWLKQQGVIPYLTGLVTVTDEDGFVRGHVDITEAAIHPIPADIAEKLGIVPNE